MRLDAYAYRKLEETTQHEYENGVQDVIRVWNDRGFEGREAPLVLGHYYTAGGCMDAFSGAYSRYSRFREHLAMLAGYPGHATDFFGFKYTQGCWDSPWGPFWELINFSDCEGVIGTDACVKLAADFKEFQDGADKAVGEFLGHYNSFRRAFEYASEEGCVVFR